MPAMVEGSKSVGRTVKVATQTENGSENSPIEAYYAFPASNVTQEVTYDKRAAALSAALGNKDSVKG